jgi:hypothetical protein
MPFVPVLIVQHINAREAFALQKLQRPVAVDVRFRMSETSLGRPFLYVHRRSRTCTADRVRVSLDRHQFGNLS